MERAERDQSTRHLQATLLRLAYADARLIAAESADDDDALDQAALEYEDAEAALAQAQLAEIAEKFVRETLDNDSKVCYT